MEVFDKPITYKNLIDMYTYLRNNEMTQELFNTCCRKGITGFHLSRLYHKFDFMDDLKDIYDDFTGEYYDKNIQIYYFSKGFHLFCNWYFYKKLQVWAVYNDLDLNDLTEDGVNYIVEDGDYILTVNNDKYEQICKNYVDIEKKYA